MIKNSEVLTERLKGVKIGDKDLTIDLLKDILSKEDSVELQAAPAHIFDDAGLQSFKERITKDAKTPVYIEGKEAGTEMLLKAIKNITGTELITQAKKNERGEIDFESTAKIVNEAMEKAKGIEPNNKIKELTSSLENLQNQIKTKEAEVTDWQGKYNGLEKNTKVNRIIQKNTPKNLMGINQDQFTVLLQAEGYSVDFDESGTPVPMQNGKVLKDKYEKALGIESVLHEFATKNKWLNGDGRGGEDTQNNTGTFKTENELMDHMKKNNISPVSKDGLQLLEDFRTRK